MIPAFVLDSRLLNSHKLAPARKQSLFDSHANLHQQLVRRGSRLSVRRVARNPAIFNRPSLQRGGENEGRALARAFMRRPDGLKAYQSARDPMALDAASHLSPHLHFGTVSVRELVRAAREMAEHQHGKAWIDELVWQEFFAQVLWHFPRAAKGAFRRSYDGVTWENDPGKFEAWSNESTGYPFVDYRVQRERALPLYRSK